MGFEVFGHHVWGVDLSDYAPELVDRIAASLRMVEMLDYTDRAEFRESRRDKGSHIIMVPQKLFDALILLAPRDASKLILTAVDKDPPDADAIVNEFFQEEVADALNAVGITPPADFELFYTDSDDDRPGRTKTPAETVIVGFGMYRDPTVAVSFSESFKMAADHHGWVTGS